MFQSISILYNYRVVLWAMVTRALSDRIAGSAFGVVFLAIYPILFLLVYASVFIYILNIRVPDLAQQTYTIVIFCGLVPFLAFAEAFSVGTSSIVSNVALVRNIMFPYELLPVKDVVAGYLVMLFGFGMVLLASIWDRGFHATQFLLPFVYVLQIIFTVGLVWITSTVNVFFRDLSKLMPIILLFLLMVSPIGYTRDMVPPRLAPILALNPLSSFIHVYRDILIHGTLPLTTLLVLTATAAIFYGLGFALMRRLRPVVFDYV